MNIDFAEDNGIGVVTVSEAMTAANVEGFRANILAWISAVPDVKSFIFDLSGVDFMDSAGLGGLIALLKRVNEIGGEMKLAGIQKKPSMVFKITRAYKVFDIYETVQNAIESKDKLHLGNM